MANKLSQVEFYALIDAHELWVETDGKQGEQLNLKGKDLGGLVANTEHAKHDDFGKPHDERIGRRDLSSSVWDDCRLPKLDLEGAILQKAEFTDCNLKEANFQDADLEEAVFYDCLATGAIFYRAQVEKTEFDRSSLAKANFFEAQGGKGTNFSRAILTGANFTDAQMSAATFSHAKIHGAIFEDAALYNANFTFADGVGTSKMPANFTDAKANDAEFMNAKLLRADFSGASLNRADFASADISKALFGDAKVQDADFQNTTGIPDEEPEYQEDSKRYEGGMKSIALIAGSEMHPLHDAGVDDLMDYVGTSHCTFDANGEQYVIVATGYEAPLSVNRRDSLDEIITTLHDESEPGNKSENFETFMYAVTEDEEYDGVTRGIGAEACSEDGMRNVAIVVPRVSVEDAQEVIDDLYEENLISESNYKDMTVEDNSSAGGGDSVWISGDELQWYELARVKEKLEEIAETVPPETRELTTYGRSRVAVEQLKKVTQEMKLAAFKKTFPKAFESVKAKLRKQTISPELARNLIKEFGMTWLVSDSVWTSHLQRLCPCDDEVLQFNIDLAALTTDEKILKTLTAIRKISHQSLHPVVNSGTIMTVGWVRFCSFPGKNTIWPLGESGFGTLPSGPDAAKPEKVLIVEEIQSDLPTVRKNVEKEGDFRRRLEAQGSKEAVDEALAVMQPFVDRFYYDALAGIFDLAAERGIDRVEMFTHETKKIFGSPMAIYEKLPKSMGMKKVVGGRSQEYVDALKPSTGRTLDEEGKSRRYEPKVWAIQVISDNPRRRNRKRKPTTWTRHQGYR